MCQSPASMKEEMEHEFRENDLCATDGFCLRIRVPKMRRSVQWQFQDEKLFLLGPVPVHGFCPAYLPGEPARYRGLPAGNPVQTLSSWHSGKGFPEHPGPCQPNQGLADLCRFRPNPDYKNQKTIRRRYLRYRTGSSSLRLGFDHYRPLPGPFPLGRVSETEGCDKAPYPSGSAWQHPFRNHHYHRKSPRCEISWTT